MDIELYYGDTKAIITPKGGYVTNLSDLKGDVLFPKRTLATPDGSEKIRGGSHVCLPNFGPGGDSGQEQHGYARVNAWEVLETTQTTAKLRNTGEGDYAGLVATLGYTVGDSLFESQLTLENTTEKDIIVAPAFHPYFTHKGIVSIDNEKVSDLGEFKEAVFVEGNKYVLQTESRLITLQSTNLPVWAQWTDQLGPYVCIEPTQSGFSFSENLSKANTIKPGAMGTYDFTIQWS